MNRINSIQFFEDCFHLAPLFGMGTQSAIGLYKIYNRYVSLVTGDFMMMTEGSKACKKYDEAKFVRPAVHRAKQSRYMCLRQMIRKR